MRLLRWYWHWCGPQGPLGASAGILFMLSLIPVGLLAAPVVAWVIYLLKPIGSLYASLFP